MIRYAVLTGWISVLCAQTDSFAYWQTLQKCWHTLNLPGNPPANPREWWDNWVPYLMTCFQNTAHPHLYTTFPYVWKRMTPLPSGEHTCPGWIPMNGWSASRAGLPVWIHVDFRKNPFPYCSSFRWILFLDSLFSGDSLRVWEGISHACPQMRSSFPRDKRWGEALALAQELRQRFSSLQNPPDTGAPVGLERYPVDTVISLRVLAKLLSLSDTCIQFLHLPHQTDFLFPGDTLWLPSAWMERIQSPHFWKEVVRASAQEYGKVRRQPPGTRLIVYTVRKGDYLGKIARRYGVSVSQLMRWNHLRNTTIYPGQQLRIYVPQP